MGTRGFWGYAQDGQLKLTYQHSGAYVGWLGERVLKHARWCANELELARKMVGELRLIEKDGPDPTPEEIDRLKCYADTGVSTGKLADWYVLLRECQGDMEATLASGVMLDCGDFPRYSLHCEWGYVIDLDAQRFEVYRGFQHHPHQDGRFSAMEPDARSGYFPVRLIKAWGMSDLPEDLSHLEAKDE